MRRNHPDVVLSVKTHQASRSVLNYQKEIVLKLHNLGLIEQADEEALLEVRLYMATCNVNDVSSSRY